MYQCECDCTGGCDSPTGILAKNGYRTNIITIAELYKEVKPCSSCWVLWKGWKCSSVYPSNIDIVDACAHANDYHKYYYDNTCDGVYIGDVDMNDYHVNNNIGEEETYNDLSNNTMSEDSFNETFLEIVKNNVSEAFDMSDTNENPTSELTMEDFVAIVDEKKELCEDLPLYCTNFANGCKPCNENSKTLYKYCKIISDIQPNNKSMCTGLKNACSMKWPQSTFKIPCNVFGSGLSIPIELTVSGSLCNSVKKVCSSSTSKIVSLILLLLAMIVHMI